MDIHGDGTIGNQPGEGASIFFPVTETLFLEQFIGTALNLALLNRTANAYQVVSLEQITGAIEPSWISSPRPKLMNPIYAGGKLEFILKGRQGASYVIERSGNLSAWETWQTVTLTASTQLISDPSGSSFYYRARLVE